MARELAFWVAIALVAVAGVALVKMAAASPAIGERWPGLAVLAEGL